MQTAIYNSGWVRILLAAILGLALCQAAQAADLFVVKRDMTMLANSVASNARTPAELPPRGTTMARVRARLGAPLRTHGAVGQPPISRWDYANYVLYFENNRLLDVVIPGQPVPLVHKDQLR